MMLRAWNRFWFAPGSASALGICRLVFFTWLSVWMSRRNFVLAGEYTSVLWMPIWFLDNLSLPGLTTNALASIQWVWRIALALSAVGYLTRVSMPVAFVLGAYLLGLWPNFGPPHYIDTLVVIATGGLALSRAGDAWSIDALVAAASLRRAGPPPASGHYRWPIRFVWVATALVVCVAGISQLRQSGLHWTLSDSLSMFLHR
ncbi:MAG: hypothetical protein C5B57_00555 [Blastocatellia bacterium]|nr:MAG: hypothetical protein C5B57_00555 [Blastocatellia bacterium]